MPLFGGGEQHPDDHRTEDLLKAETKLANLSEELSAVATDTSQHIQEGQLTVQRLKDIRQELENLRLAEMIRRNGFEA